MQRETLHDEVLSPTARSEVIARLTLHGFCSLERSRIGAKNGLDHSHWLEALAHLHGVARREKEGERRARDRREREIGPGTWGCDGVAEDRMANVTIQGRKKHVVSETFHLTQNAIQLILKFKESLIVSCW